jgi:hypothetical protein
VTITVNDEESQEVGMMLGPAGEAYFVGEEVAEGDNPYLEYEDVEEKKDDRQSRKKAKAQAKADKKRSSSEDHSQLQGVADGSGVELIHTEFEKPDGYFL